jgi:hypothetical protein
MIAWAHTRGTPIYAYLEVCPLLGAHHCWACYPTPAWTRAIMLKPNLLGSRQYVWTFFFFFFLSLMRLDTLSEPKTSLKFFSKPHVDPLISYTYLICIILIKIQLKISQWWIYILAPYLKKKNSCVINTSWILLTPG